MIIHVRELGKSCKSCIFSPFLFFFFLNLTWRDLKSSVCLLGRGPTERRRIICGFKRRQQRR